MSIQILLVCTAMWKFKDSITDDKILCQISVAMLQKFVDYILQTKLLKVSSCKYRKWVGRQWDGWTETAKLK